MTTPSPLRNLAPDEFAPETTYLNTSSYGLAPRRTVEAVKALAERNATGRDHNPGSYETVEQARAAFGRLLGVPAQRVAIGASVSAHVSVVAAALAPGSEVLLPEGEFASLVTPFSVRGELKVRYVGLERLAGEIRPETALVAWSGVQSADGRVADDTAIREAAAAHGARTLLDMSQSAGWLPTSAGLYDYTVAGGFKYLLCPRGTSFLTVSEQAQEYTPPLQAGWLAAEDTWASNYGPVSQFASSARRFDTSAAFLCYVGAVESLALVESIGVAAIHAHNVALADLFREGVAALGHTPVPSPGSAVVAVPGLGARAEELAAAGVMVSAREGNLRASFHLYNGVGDVERVLGVLGSGGR
ncbi:aminotransferase class V-fold PLP-dependent enzyme [Streptomyces candidus]|uniref:Selenocysteine lyase/cysteine desulfurase n=1 Tax=Streptomyces candidus TaxID=67283 RepID=A0A7X0HMQ4_9ACTN|nr:aminotransferase class V-fold PLP-dependent enzyme [Streptomyces candidus]MBB6439219.1 selenocysteine lyase/cysteine desulfurase [Streptomyces candidus]